MTTAFVFVYFSLLIFVAIYGIHLYWLIFEYWRSKKVNLSVPHGCIAKSNFPKVTVQLPIYNEMRVALRLVRAIENFDWPAKSLQIQILDDSTDCTSEIIDNYLAGRKDSKIKIEHIRRSHRTGFKAGALQHGLATASGEFVAIFDSDNLPQPDFLIKMMPFFNNPSTGMVQARWSFLNRHESLLCRAQALFLDAHFAIEQQARFFGGLLFNFNGTAGIWRRTTIDDAGGWQGDTLTEDLDLSFRAQLAGWRFVYFNDYSVPTELPGTIASFKAQQYRWAKGAIQTGLKLAGRIRRSRIPLLSKVAVFFHLTSKMLSPALLALAVLLVPALYIRLEAGTAKLLLIDLPIFVAGTLSMSIFYSLAYRSAGRNRKLSDLWVLPTLTSIGIGLAVNNTRAIVSALINNKTPFVRTPKSGSTDNQYRLVPSAYRIRADRTLVVETALAFYSTAALVIAGYLELYVSIPFLSTFAFGFVYFAWRGFMENYAR